MKTQKEEGAKGESQLNRDLCKKASHMLHRCVGLERTTEMCNQPDFGSALMLCFGFNQSYRAVVDTEIFYPEKARAELSSLSDEERERIRRYGFVLSFPRPTPLPDQQKADIYYHKNLKEFEETVLECSDIILGNFWRVPSTIPNIFSLKNEDRDELSPPKHYRIW